MPGSSASRRNYVTGVWFGNDDFTEMNKMTGGTLPAMTWSKYMMEASIGKTAAALPGLPVDESHILYAQEHPPGSMQIQVGVPGTAPTAPGGASIAATDLGETGADDVNVITPPGRSADAVVQVLQDMFGFFGKKQNIESSQPTKKKKSENLGAPSKNR